jgi:hypothetical protein
MTTSENEGAFRRKGASSAKEGHLQKKDVVTKEEVLKREIKRILERKTTSSKRT